MRSRASTQKIIQNYLLSNSFFFSRFVVHHINKFEYFYGGSETVEKLQIFFQNFRRLHSAQAGPRSRYCFRFLFSVFHVNRGRRQYVHVNVQKCQKPGEKKTLNLIKIGPLSVASQQKFPLYNTYVYMFPLSVSNITIIQYYTIRKRFPFRIL